MTRRTMSGLAAIALAMALATCLPHLALAQPPSTIELRAMPEELAFDAGAVYDGLRLTLAAPDGNVFDLHGDAASILFLDLRNSDGEPLPDGLYAYELRGAHGDREELLRSGFFSIRDGEFVSPEIEETPGDGGGRGAAPLATKSTVLAIDDGIIRSSLCVGIDCSNAETFGFTTLKLKENNLRIEFDDTSSTASFPTTDWQIRANEETNGGANELAIDDLDSGKTPFSILGGAPNDSLFVAATGRIGVGTSTPVRQMHLLNGDTPGFRLEQDGSRGFFPQTWDVAGNEAWFFIQDVTHGSNTRPFLIVTGAPDKSLYIAKTGDVGLGTDTPAARLDVVGDIALSGTVDGRDIAADGASLDAHVADLANPHQVTAAQAGADPAGSASAAVAAHEAAFDHGNIPSALPVPVSEGGTGATDAATARANLGIEEDATKAGIAPASSFAGNPALATVAFATPYPVGTSYVVELTAVTGDAKSITTPNVVAKDETGFMVTLGGKAKDLVEVDWLARPVGE